MGVALEGKNERLSRIETRERMKSNGERKVEAFQALGIA
jgi:hypothetical protein